MPSPFSFLSFDALSNLGTALGIGSSAGLLVGFILLIGTILLLAMFRVDNEYAYMGIVITVVVINAATGMWPPAVFVIVLIGLGLFAWALIAGGGGGD